MADSRTVCISLLLATSRDAQKPRQEKGFGVPVQVSCSAMETLTGLLSTGVVWLKPERVTEWRVAAAASRHESWISVRCFQGGTLRILFKLIVLV